MKRIKPVSVLMLLILFCLCFDAVGQPANSHMPLSFQLNLGFVVPIGETADFYTFGGSTHLTGLYVFESLPWLSVGANIDFEMIQMNNRLFLQRAGVSPQVRFGTFLGSSVYLYGFGQGGYSLSFVDIAGETVAGSKAFLTTGGGVSLYLSDSFGIGVRAAYENHFGFYNGILLCLGTELRVSGKGRENGLEEEAQPTRPQPLSETTGAETEVSIESIEFYQVFPVFYKYYDTHPLGIATIRNSGDTTVEILTVNTFINSYMDMAKKNAVSITLQPGEIKEVNLYALFNSSVFEITEATKVAAEISLDCIAGGERHSVSKASTLRIYDRNALTWDDDRKAAAFISSKDPSVLGIAKNIAGIVTRHGSNALNNNLLMGIGIHAALPQLGLSYVIDPQTPYQELSEKSDVVDFLQYPRQTLYFRAGDCDDLSILYCSFLEAVGIETAFITIPGHIYIAFSTGMNAEEARSNFSRQDDLIYHNEQAWIPVEVTMIDDGFLAAWQKGAKQWRENNSRDQAQIYPVHEAWNLYEPTGIAAGVEGMQLSNIDAVSESFSTEMAKFVSREIYPKVTQIQGLIQQQGESGRLLNKLGVVYARYGLFDEAEEYFAQAMSEGPYSPAVINLGNIHFLKRDYIKAAEYFERAYELDPGSTTALLGLARTNHELENYSTVRMQYEELRNLDPKLADRFAYLDLRGEEAGRAAEAVGVSETILWEEEE